MNKVIDLENFRFSRSHQTDYRKCERLGLLRFWLDGHGYTRAGVAIELSTGTLYHNTAGEILEWVLANDQQTPPATVIREAVRNQTEIYKADMAEAVGRIMTLGLDDKVEWAGWHKIIKRQAALSEAMVRAWFKCRFPVFQTNYELLSVEGEEQSELSPGLFFMQRKDSVWRHKIDHTMHPLEFKTSGTNDADFVESWNFDLQQITHLLNFKNKYGEDPKSVLVEIIWKGRKYKDEHVGALVSGWKKEEVVAGFDDQLDVSYDYDYSRCRTKGWQKFWVVDEDFGAAVSPIEFWMESVLDFETINAHCLDIEIPHSHEKVSRWLNQTRREMREVRDNLVQLQGIDDEAEAREFMDVAFPCRDSKDNCAPYFGKKNKRCAFIHVCHGSLEPEELKHSQEYSRRQPHHPQEFGGGDETR